MNRSFIENQLKDKGISEEDIKTIVQNIIDENGKDINNEKARTESVRNELKVKEALVDELNAKIKEASSVDIEKIKKEQFDLGKAEGSKEVDEFKKTNALRNSIKGAKDFDLVCSKLDQSKIEYEKNEKGDYIVKGIDEQLESVKKNFSYLFENEKTIDINLGGEHKNMSETDELDVLKQAMGIEEKKG